MAINATIISGSRWKGSGPSLRFGSDFVDGPELVLFS